MPGGGGANSAPAVLAPSDACHCGNRAEHDRDECRARRDLIADLYAYSRGSDRPPSAVDVLDLWGHLSSGRHRVADEQASHVVRIVLDLGWRPFVTGGSGSLATWLIRAEEFLRDEAANDSPTAQRLLLTKPTPKP